MITRQYLGLAVAAFVGGAVAFLAMSGIAAVLGTGVQEVTIVGWEIKNRRPIDVRIKNIRPIDVEIENVLPIEVNVGNALLDVHVANIRPIPVHEEPGLSPSPQEVNIVGWDTSDQVMVEIENILPVDVRISNAVIDVRVGNALPIPVTIEK